ncbi:MAG: ATP-binding cassette domain-containing protein, partial [Chloroflexota bacterium]
MLLSLSHVAKGFGPSAVLDDVSFVVNEADRLALVGANGVGKTTLLRILAGEVAPDGGEVVVPKAIDIGYLPQAVRVRAGQKIDDLTAESQGKVNEVAGRLRDIEAVLGQTGDRTEGGNGILQAALAAYADLTEQFERLGGYELDHRIDALFAGLAIDHLPRDREVASLSGGEKARVALAALFLRAPDLLLLDEPTNHLDFAALEWLEGYLRVYRGAFLVVSHDRHFLNRTVRAI